MAVIRATIPTPIEANLPSPNKDVEPTDMAPLKIDKIITGRSMKAVLLEKSSSDFL
jgi:hypothetical protein